MVQGLFRYYSRTARKSAGNLASVFLRAYAAFPTRCRLLFAFSPAQTHKNRAEPLKSSGLFLFTQVLHILWDEQCLRPLAQCARECASLLLLTEASLRRTVGTLKRSIATGFCGPLRFFLSGILNYQSSNAIFTGTASQNPPGNQRRSFLYQV